MTINGVALVPFVIARVVDWRFAVPMAVIALAGGYFGAQFFDRCRRNIRAPSSLAIGIAMTALFFTKTLTSHVVYSIALIGTSVNSSSPTRSVRFDAAVEAAHARFDVARDPQIDRRDDDERERRRDDQAADDDRPQRRLRFAAGFDAERDRQHAADRRAASS